MSDLIDRQAAINAISCDITITGRQNAELVAATIGKFADRIKALPSVQPERKTGEWILSDVQNPEDVRNGNYTYTCSNCLHSDIHAKTAVVPFCWHCGADMSGADMREEN